MAESIKEGTIEEARKQAREAPVKRINGVIVPYFCSEKWILEDMRKTLVLRSDDNWVVSYPKAGTNWAQQIVRFIQNGGRADQIRITDAMPWVEGFNEIPEVGYSYGVNLNEISPPRSLQSHFSYTMMPCGLPSSTPGKYIYIARNPKDLCVSLYFYNKRLPFYPHYEWDELFEHYIDGEIEFGDYFDHVLSWWAHKDDENVLFLKYEDMKKNLPHEVARIARFLGYDLSSEMIQTIAEMTTFKSMKRDNSVNHSWESIDATSDTPFMRKGEVGDWKNYFSPEQSERFDAKYSERMKGIGLEFDFS